MRKQFNKTLLNLAKRDKRIILIFGDISVYLFNNFKLKFPKRFYNLGICESSLISLSAGLRFEGFIPFVHSIAPFVTERAIEQIKVDLVYNNLHLNPLYAPSSIHPKNLLLQYYGLPGQKH